MITLVGKNQKKKKSYDEDVYFDGYFNEDGNWVYYADEEYEDELNYDEEEEETYQTYWIVDTTSTSSTQTTETGSSSSSESTTSNGETTTTTSTASVNR